MEPDPHAARRNDAESRPTPAERPSSTPPPSTPSPARGEDRDEHGVTAEDAGGVGFGEEGFRAEDYPGDNPLQGESEREQRRRHAYAWTWPRPTHEALASTGDGAASDRRICEEIGRRILRAERDLSCVIVGVRDGRVTLEGEVAESNDERVVEALAENVEGVRSVESALVVRSSGTSAG